MLRKCQATNINTTIMNSNLTKFALPNSNQYILFKNQLDIINLPTVHNKEMHLLQCYVTSLPTKPTSEMNTESSERPLNTVTK